MINEQIKYKAYLIHNFRTIPQLEKLSKQEQEDIEVVGNVLPFKVNNYVVDELIDWDNYKTDPIFRLSFPQKEMLEEEDFLLMKKTLAETTDKAIIKEVADKIRYSLNPQDRK